MLKSVSFIQMRLIYAFLYLIFGRSEGLITIQKYSPIGTPAVESRSGGLFPPSLSLRLPRLFLVGLNVPLQIILAAVALFALAARERPHALVQFVDMPSQRVQFGEGFAADGAVVLHPPADLGAHRFGRLGEGSVEREVGQLDLRQP